MNGGRLEFVYGTVLFVSPNAPIAGPDAMLSVHSP